MSKRTVKQRAQARRSRQQNQWLIIGGVVVAAIAVVVILVVIGNASNPAAEIDLTRYKGIPQSVDRTGAPGIALGDASASATLVEYSDFSCPHCRVMADTVHQLVDLYVREGKLRIIYKPVTFINPANSPGASRAMYCGAEQGKGWEMHDAVWSVFDTNSPGAYTLDVFAIRATSIGLDVGKFRDCFNSVETTTALTELEDERLRMGVNSTPSMFLNGQEILASPANLISQIAEVVGD